MWVLSALACSDVGAAPSSRPTPTTEPPAAIVLHVADPAFAPSHHKDAVTAMYLARLDVLAGADDVVPESFDGVFDHTEK